MEAALKMRTPIRLTPAERRLVRETIRECIRIGGGSLEFEFAYLRRLIDGRAFGGLRPAMTVTEACRFSEWNTRSYG